MISSCSQFSEFEENFFIILSYLDRLIHFHQSIKWFDFYAALLNAIKLPNSKEMNKYIFIICEKLELRNVSIDFHDDEFNDFFESLNKMIDFEESEDIKLDHLLI